jgi:hypothetical protein
MSRPMLSVVMPVPISGGFAADVASLRRVLGRSDGEPHRRRPSVSRRLRLRRRTMLRPIDTTDGLVPRSVPDCRPPVGTRPHARRKRRRRPTVRALWNTLMRWNHRLAVCRGREGEGAAPCREPRGLQVFGRGLSPPGRMSSAFRLYRARAAQSAARRDGLTCCQVVRALAAAGVAEIPLRTDLSPRSRAIGPLVRLVRLRGRSSLWTA